MFLQEILEAIKQLLLWIVLIISVPVLVGCVVAFPIMCEVEMNKEKMQ